MYANASFWGEGVHSHFWQFGNRNNEVSHSEAKLPLYVNLLKHSMLFHRRLVLADHMVVNSPNFLRCVRDHALRDIISKETVSIAYIGSPLQAEEDKNSHYDLLRMRQFYRRYNLYHEETPQYLAAADFDAEVVAIEDITNPLYRIDNHRDARLEDALKRFISSSSFRRLCLPEATNETVELSQRQFRFAMSKCRERYGSVGIIHFDPTHRDQSEQTVFEIIRTIPGVASSTENPVHNRQFRRELTRIANVFLMRAETAAVNVSPILTPHEAKYVELFSREFENVNMQNGNSRSFSFSLTTACLSPKGLTALSGRDIIGLRDTPAAQSYFDLIDKIGGDFSGNVSMAEETIRRYIHEIDRLAYDRHHLLRTKDATPEKIDSKVTLTIHDWVQDVRGSLGVMFQLATAVGNVFFWGIPKFILPYVAQHIDKLTTRADNPVAADKIIQDDDELTCYRSIGQPA
jgi:hypothetical protein